MNQALHALHVKLIFVEQKRVCLLLDFRNAKLCRAVAQQSNVDKPINAFGRLAEAVNELIHNIARILIRFNVCDAAVNVQTQRGGIDVAFRDMRLHLHVHGAFLHGVLGRFAFHHGHSFV